MRDIEREIYFALACCTFPPASWDKRFVRDISAHAEHAPDEPLTDRQAAHLLRLAHKYRRQIPTRIIELALDEMERRADERAAQGLPALPDFKRRVRREPPRARPVQEKLL